MIFKKLTLPGSYLVEPKCFEDERGKFIKIFAKEAFDEIGLVSNFVECNRSQNLIKGTIRGMHFQKHPYEEVKLVCCTKGSIYDVIIDLRPDSPTYKKWIAVELNDRDQKALYVPQGFAHGFQTLEDESEVLYQVSAPYRAEYSREVRWNDPAFKIIWPLEVTKISKKDRECLDFA